GAAVWADLVCGQTAFDDVCFESECPRQGCSGKRVHDACRAGRIDGSCFGQADVIAESVVHEVARFDTQFSFARFTQSESGDNV
ncbi:hypothetical protein, partial [Klebsiella pneumoniae]|uniref:hypothetical protein n=1 Tax=Klebsiella pneumoniae TaxID=573 RepID=UPI0027308E02